MIMGVDSTFECRRPCVLVAVSASEASARARAYAIGLARRQGARLVAVYVQDSAMNVAAAPEVAEVSAQLRADAAADLRLDISDASRHFELPLEFQVRDGEPVRQILALAHELPADVVVVGWSRRRLRWSRQLASALIRRAELPVVVVP